MKQLLLKGVASTRRMASTKRNGFHKKEYTLNSKEHFPLKLINRPIQLLHPSELYCEGMTNKDEKKNKLNPSPMEFRPKRTVAEIAKWRLKDFTIENDEGDIS